MKWIDKHSRFAPLVYIPAIIWFLSTYVARNIQKLWAWLMSYAMASVTISKGDRALHECVQEWKSAHAMFRTRRSLTAQSASHNAQADCMNDTEGGNIIFGSSPRTEFIRYEGQLFIYTEGQSHFTIWCFGYSPKRIQKLLCSLQVAEAVAVETRGQTEVWSATSYGDWDLQSVKIRRSLVSVCLDSNVKNMLVDDIEDYLHPETAIWYAENEVPYRRGYLLYGKPGCGKTSLAMAIAGHFKLDVHTLSLLDNGMTDTTLLNLFRELGPNALVLLEDVDCAGLGRELRKRDNDSTAPGGVMVASNIPAIGAPIEVAGQVKKREPPPRVTLAGLLNAIDGVSAPEGHVVSSSYPNLSGF